jgi:VIT1/CCC1 family predicted Fe2+/Mn2+ transporter
MGIFLLCFLSTFPIVVPFIFVNNARFALRISNAVACAMLLVCGYAFGYYSGFRPWAMGLAMVGIGGVLIGVAILLGG